jgi:hypothetical protein
MVEFDNAKDLIEFMKDEIEAGVEEIPLTPQEAKILIDNYERIPF